MRRLRPSSISKVGPTEKQIESEILLWLNCQAGVRAFKIETGGFFDAKRGFYRKRNSLMEVGTPDILACIAGMFVAFEVKRKKPKGRLSLEQAKCLDDIKTRGLGQAFVVYSLDEVRAITTGLLSSSKTAFAKSVDPQTGHSQ